MDEQLLDSIITKETSTKYYDHFYSLIQLSIPQTFEIINLGVILKDSSGEVNVQIIPDPYKLANCFYIENLSGLAYALHILTDRVKNYKKITPGKTSEHLFVTDPEPYTSDKQGKEALMELFDETVSIMKSMDKKSVTVNQYDKPHILSSLKEIAEKKNYSNISFNKSVGSVHKKIDAVILAKNKPVVAAEVVSPYVQEYIRNFGESLIVMQELESNENVKEKLLYMPIITELTTKQKKYFNTAMAMAKKHNITVNTSKDYGEFIGVLKDLARPYQGELF